MPNKEPPQLHSLERLFCTLLTATRKVGLIVLQPWSALMVRSIDNQVLPTSCCPDSFWTLDPAKQPVLAALESPKMEPPAGGDSHQGCEVSGWARSGTKLNPACFVNQEVSQKLEALNALYPSIDPSFYRILSPKTEIPNVVKACGLEAQQRGPVEPVDAPKMEPSRTTRSSPNCREFQTLCLRVTRRYRWGE